MRFVIQRVSSASVEINGRIVGSVEKGFCVLIGISKTDDETVAEKMVRKMLGLRIFEDENGKTNLSLSKVGGNLLLVPQFTLYADCRRGNRPGFTAAGAPDCASALFDRIAALCRAEFPDAACGVFGADMKVSLVNDGPFTILLDSDQL